MLLKPLKQVGAALLLAGLAYSTPLKLDYTGGPSKFTSRSGREWEIPHRHVASVPYQIGRQNWEVWTDPDPPRYLRGTANAGDYFNILSSTYKPADGWVYTSAVRELSDDSLIVHWYEAFHGGTSVGVNFGIEYAPHEGDPADVHWLQVVVSNHKIGARHGTPERTVDEANPNWLYYDNGGAANNRFLRDRPRRSDHGEAHDWLAYLFLVSGPAVNNNRSVTPGNITFYGGVEWGWHNACRARNGEFCSEDSGEVPEPSTLTMLVAGAILIAIRIIPLRRNVDSRSV